MPDAVRNQNSQENVIDLTIEDSDDSTPPPITTSARKPFSSSWRIKHNAVIPEHVLPLDGVLQTSTQWVPEISRLLLPNVSEFAKSPSRTHRPSPPQFVFSHPGSEKFRSTHSCVTSSAKRRRVEVTASASHEENILNLQVAEIPPSPEAEVLQSRSSQPSAAAASTRELLPSSHGSSPQSRQQNRPAANGYTVSDAGVNKSLKVALRQQVFPHINQRLSHYRRAIDSVTRKQLGKKVAWKICGKDFMDNMLQNDGRLSAVFEEKVTTMAQTLVDQFAEDVLRNSKKAKNCGSIVRDDSLHKEAHRNNVPVMNMLKEGPRAEAVQAAAQAEAIRAAATQAEAAEAKRSELTKARTAAKLRAIMKARWESGVMKPAMDRRSARTLRKKGRLNVSQQIPPKLMNKSQAWHRQKDNSQEMGRSLHEIASKKEASAAVPGPVPIICLDSSDGTDDDAVPTPKSPTSQMSSLVPLPGNNVAQLATVTADFQGERNMNLKISSNGFSQQSMAPNSDQKDALPTSPKLQFKSKALFGTKPREKIATINTYPRPIPPAKSASLIRQLEDLRLAVLDDQVPRPYLNFQDREDILRGLRMLGSDNGSQATLSTAETTLLQSSIVHVDFCPEEIESIVQFLKLLSGKETYLETQNSKAHVEFLLLACQRQGHSISDISTSYQSMKTQHIPGRTDAAVSAFLEDAASALVSEKAAITRIQSTRANLQDDRHVADSVSAMLQKREIWGRRRDLQHCRSTKARILCYMEDELTRQAEWTDCSGDIATVSWVDSDRYFCGATAHSDEHNMQYNKAGNLLLGSIRRQTMNSVAGHQVVRPIVARGENASQSMRQTQDPWLYSSVTSTVYSHQINKCFTGSYDQTVKIWDISNDGSAMKLCGTWLHSGNVNFVAASYHHRMIATAADVCENAVRVYRFNPDDIDGSVFTTYEPSVQQRNGNDIWAYFPATMQWGISSMVSQLLLVGYSPRSFDCHDGDIPEDKLNTGELCLWDANTGRRVPISSGKTQNIFEVIWHPSQPIFVAATSPAGEFASGVKTQLRIFGQTEYGAFTQMKALDCPAQDINEITIRPNSLIHCYVTASCTDGNTYVWDSALSDKPIHVLEHGDSIDDQVHGNSKEETDTGVKFAAWGKSSEKFYTGSSDGVVKVWNIRAPTGEAFLRDMITLSGGVSTGKFSPDFRQLVVGDSTGKIHLFSLVESKIDLSISAITRKAINPHAPLPPPLVDEDDQDIPPEQTGPEIGQQFLDRRQIIVHPDEYVGAIQGPNYQQTGLFYNAILYKDENGYDAEGWSQEELQERQKKRFQLKEIKLPRLSKVKSSSHSQHERNFALDLNLATLPRETIIHLKDEGVDLRFQDEIDQRLEKSKESKIGTHYTNFKFMDDSDGNDDSLDDNEIQELQQLKGIIQQGLKIHRTLKDLL